MEVFINFFWYSCDLIEVDFDIKRATLLLLYAKYGWHYAAGNRSLQDLITLNLSHLFNVSFHIFIDLGFWMIFLTNINSCLTMQVFVTQLMTRVVGTPRFFFINYLMMFNLVPMYSYRSPLSIETKISTNMLYIWPLSCHMWFVYKSIM